MAPTKNPTTNYSPATPFVTTLSYSDGSEAEYVPMEIPKEQRHGPKFAILPEQPQDDADNLQHAAAARGAEKKDDDDDDDAVELSLEMLSAVFLPNGLLQAMTKHTNAHALRRLPAHKVQRPVTVDEMYRFVAAYYSMGVTKLPSRHDYWTNDDFWPRVPIPRMFEKERFEYIWKNLRVTCLEDNEEERGLADGDDESVDDEDQSEWFDSTYDDVNGGIIRREQGPEPDPEVDEQFEPSNEQRRCYAKIQPLVDHVNKASQTVCAHPGFALALDEQLRPYEGPIKTGCPFLALCDASTGYTYHMEPNGEYAAGSIRDKVTRLVTSLPQRNELQYVVAVDTCFADPTLVADLRNLGVAAVGPARANDEWPPEEITTIDDKRFNTLYLLNDPMNMLIARWTGNRHRLTLVSTMHTGAETQLRDQRRPRETDANRQDIRRVWGKQVIRKISIPGVVNDYEKWMKGMDKSDQMIMAYHPNLQCRRRTWMSILFHCLDVMRANAYIAFRYAHGARPSTDSHTDFVLQWCEQLCHRADAVRVARNANAQQVANALYPEWPDEPQETVATAAVATAATAMELDPESDDEEEEVEKQTKKKRRTGKNSELPAERLMGNPEDHIVTIGTQQQRCVYCAYLAMECRRDGQPIPHMRKVTRRCVACDVPLCKDHFDVYHTEQPST